MGGGSDINAEFENDVGAQANLEGEFNTEKPSSPNNDEDVLDLVTSGQPINGKTDPVPGDVNVDDISQEIGDPIGSSDDFEDLDRDLDPSVMSIVSGCLTQKIKDEDDLDRDGIKDNSCSKTFVRDDIIVHCDGLDNGLDSLDDRCYIMSALMNRNVEYCEYIEDPGLEGKCVGALGG